MLLLTFAVIGCTIQSSDYFQQKKGRQYESQQRLMIAATFDPTKRTSLITVADMCRKIEENSISLPLYQRDISWTLQKCIDLLNYQLWGKGSGFSYFYQCYKYCG